MCLVHRVCNMNISHCPLHEHQPLLVLIKPRDRNEMIKGVIYTTSPK